MADTRPLAVQGDIGPVVPEAIAVTSVDGAQQPYAAWRQHSERGQQQVGSGWRDQVSRLPPPARRAGGQLDDTPARHPERRGDQQLPAGERGDVPGREVEEAGAGQV
ncbi:MAG TPA: hypothetical protein VH589_03110 [Trebonia sp.]